MKFSNQTVFIILLATQFITACPSLDASKLETQRDLSEIVESEDVDPDKSALLIVRLEDGAEWVSGGDRIETTYPPASTSKIPHTLIALETGYVDGPDNFFVWDGTKRFVDVWNQDQTLSSAFEYSAVWVYQEITRGIGYETMTEWMDRFEYGNCNIGMPEDITTYWLVGPLETSARDQVQFLSKLGQPAFHRKSECQRVDRAPYSCPV